MRQLMPGGRGLWQLFERLVAGRSAAIRPVPLPAALDAVPRLTAAPTGNRDQSFAPDVLAAIATGVITDLIINSR